MVIKFDANYARWIGSYGEKSGANSGICMQKSDETKKKGGKIERNISLCQKKWINANKSISPVRTSFVSHICTKHCHCTNVLCKLRFWIGAFTNTALIFVRVHAVSKFERKVALGKPTCSTFHRYQFPVPLREIIYRRCRSVYEN